MRKLFLVFLLFQVVLFAQMNNTNRWIMRGDATTLQFFHKDDLTDDSLIFVVKASKLITAVRLIEKTTYDSEITVDNKFIYIQLLAGDTDDLTLAKYYYDITRISDGDTTTIFIGELNLQPDIGTPFDGTDVTGRVTTVSLNNGSTDRELIWWNDSLEYWEPSGVTSTSGGSVGNADSLGGIPASDYSPTDAMMDSILAYRDSTIIYHSVDDTLGMSALIDSSLGVYDAKTLSKMTTGLILPRGTVNIDFSNQTLSVSGLTYFLFNDNGHIMRHVLVGGEGLDSNLITNFDFSWVSGGGQPALVYFDYPMDVDTVLYLELHKGGAFILPALAEGYVRYFVGADYSVDTPNLGEFLLIWLKQNLIAFEDNTSFNYVPMGGWSRLGQGEIYWDAAQENLVFQDLIGGGYTFRLYWASPNAAFPKEVFLNIESHPEYISNNRTVTINLSGATLNRGLVLLRIDSVQATDEYTSLNIEDDSNFVIVDWGYEITEDDLIFGFCQDGQFYSPFLTQTITDADIEDVVDSRLSGLSLITEQTGRAETFLKGELSENKQVLKLAYFGDSIFLSGFEAATNDGTHGYGTLRYNGFPKSTFDYLNFNPPTFRGIRHSDWSFVGSPSIVAGEYPDQTSVVGEYIELTTDTQEAQIDGITGESTVVFVFEGGIKDNATYDSGIASIQVSTNGGSTWTTPTALGLDGELTKYGFETTAVYDTALNEFNTAFEYPANAYSPNTNNEGVAPFREVTYQLDSTVTYSFKIMLKSGETLPVKLWGCYYFTGQTLLVYDVANPGASWASLRKCVYNALAINNVDYVIMQAPMYHDFTTEANIITDAEALVDEIYEYNSMQLALTSCPPGGVILESSTSTILGDEEPSSVAGTNFVWDFNHRRGFGSESLSWAEYPSLGTVYSLTIGSNVYNGTVSTSKVSEADFASWTYKQVITLTFADEDAFYDIDSNLTYSSTLSKVSGDGKSSITINSAYLFPPRMDRHRELVKQIATNKEVKFIDIYQAFENLANSVGENLETAPYAMDHSHPQWSGLDQQNRRYRLVIDDGESIPFVNDTYSITLDGSSRTLTVTAVGAYDGSNSYVEFQLPTAIYVGDLSAPSILWSSATYTKVSGSGAATLTGFTAVYNYYLATYPITMNYMSNYFAKGDGHHLDQPAHSVIYELIKDELLSTSRYKEPEYATTIITDSLAQDIADIEVGSFTQPDSTVFASELTAGLATKQNADADLTDLADGELTASKVGGVKDADYGDVTVSGGAWAVEDNSHSHTIANVTGLQDSLNKFLEISEAGSGGVDTSVVNDLINEALAGQDSGYYVAKVEGFSANEVAMTVNSDSGDILVIMVNGIHPDGWTGSLVTLAYASTSLNSYLTNNNQQLPVNLIGNILVSDSSDVNFGIYCQDLDAWASNQSATVITLKKGIAGNSTQVFDTLSMSINIPDTVIAGDNAIWKIPNNITITEIASFTNTGTVTFNLEERGETTPNTSGTDVIGSDLVADDNQQETSTFTNATLDRDDWLALVVASITGDPTLFGVTIRYIKAN